MAYSLRSLQKKDKVPESPTIERDKPAYHSLVGATGLTFNDLLSPVVCLDFSSPTITTPSKSSKIIVHTTTPTTVLSTAITSPVFSHLPHLASTHSPLIPRPSPVETSLPSTVSPVVTSLPSKVSPAVTSLPSTTSSVVTSLTSTLSPVVTSLTSTLSPVVTSLPSTLFPVVTSLPSV